MNYKIHAIIIVVIATVLAVVWQLLGTKPEPTPIAEVQSPYSIEISRATYGLSCQDYYNRYYKNSKGEDLNYVDPYGDLKDKIEQNLKENNVLEPVSKICKGKDSCSFIVQPATFNFDPFPACASKDLRIEYRCYKVDRIRVAVFKEKHAARINCNALFD